MLMKNLLTILIFFVSLTCSATNYYVSNAGSNSNNGTSPSTPWQTVAKVVSSLGSINATDSVLFKCDDNFDITAAIVMVKNGVRFGSYGTGARPSISALATVSGWTLVSTGLYKASITCPNDLRYVTVNDNPVEWGRTPNKNNGLNSYYYSSSYSNGTPKTITLAGMPTSPSRVGHRFALKGQTWAMGIAKCTAQSTSTLTYVVGSENLLGLNPTFRYPSTSGTGICFVGNVADCDTLYEWAYDSTAHELYMFFGNTNPNSVTVKASKVDKIFDMVGFYNNSITNLELVGANKAAVFGKNGGGNGSQIFRSVRITGSGSKGIIFSNQQNIIFEDDTIVNCLGISLRINSASVRDGASIKRNYIVDNGPFETMAYCGDFSEDGSAIICGANNADITYNTIIRSNYHGIWATGSNVLVERNLVRRWGMYNNDCGGLYTIGLAGTGAIPIYTNRICRNNVFDSGRAWVYGYSKLQTAEAKGVYDDARTYNWTHENNLVRFCDIGFSNNNPNGVTIRSNTVIAFRGMNFRKYDFDDLTSFNVKRNIFSNTASNSFTYAYVAESAGSLTVAQDFAGDVNIDSNICNSGSPAYSTTVAGATTNYHIGTWRTATGVSAADSIVPFIPLGETGRKLVLNWSATTITFPLTYKYRNYYGQPYYSGSIQLAPYSWALLVYDGPLDGSPPPPPPSPGTYITAPFIIKP